MSDSNVPQPTAPAPSEQSTQERADRLMARLQDVTEQLAASHRQADIFQIVLRPTLQALTGKAGRVLLVEGHSLRVAAQEGHDEAANSIWQAGPLSDRTPATDVLRTRDPLFFEHGGSLTAAYPELEKHTGGKAAVASAVLPMFLEGEPLGTLVLDFREPHHFTAEEIRFLRTLAAQCAIALGRARLMTDLQRQVRERTRKIEQDARAHEAFVAFTEAVGTQTDELALARQAIGVLRARFVDGTVVYYTREDDLWKARAWSDDLSEALIETLTAGLPNSTPIIRRTLRAGTAFFTDAWNARDEHIEHTEAYGTAAGYPLSVNGQVNHLLLFGLKDTAQWSVNDQALVRVVGRGLTLALDRAEQARQLDEERAALAAFADLTEAVGTETNVLTLASQALEVLRGRFADCTGGYYVLEDGRWKLRLWTDDLQTQPDLLRELQAGLPLDTPILAELLRTAAPVFVENWDAEREQVERTDEYASGSAYPLFRNGRVVATLALSRKRQARWSERDRGVVRAVGRSLGLALERVEQSERLARQNAELDARTKALESFAELTRDLSAEMDKYVLVRRAQEVVLSLLSEGYALYYEREGERWRNRVQVGEVGHADLQAFIDAGPAVGVTPTVDIPWTTRRALYQDHYARGSDTPEEMVGHVSAAASLPVLSRGEVVGVFIAVLFAQRTWTNADREVLETVVRSLGLALERAEGVVALAQRTRELERSNAELEQFAYVASHDLQEPLRTVTSFSQLLAGRYAGQLDDKADLYIRLISEGTARMGQLLQDLLAFARVASEAGALVPVETQVILAQVVQDLHAQIGRTGARVQVGALPAVLGDASQLRQLFQNLIGNALKFSAPGRTPQVRVDAARDGDLWRFSVADNGVGIAPEFFERIFTIFQRLHTRDRYEGNGIGLSITRKIVERHGGQLWLESTPDVGTTFFFILPAAGRTT